MNNIRAVHTELHSDQNNRNWLVWTTAFIHQVRQNRVHSQSMCGEHWWLHVSVEKDVPKFRNKTLPDDDVWSPYYEPVS